MIQADDSNMIQGENSNRIQADDSNRIHGDNSKIIQADNSDRNQVDNSMIIQADMDHSFIKEEPKVMATKNLSMIALN